MDKIVMLLSSDWFLPYWNTLGIGDGGEQNACLQKACREIVQQIMGEGAREHCNASFSPERLQATAAMLTAAMRKCRFREDAFRQINEMILRHDASESDAGNFAWVLSALTKKLLMSDAVSEESTALFRYQRRCRSSAGR